MRLRLFGLMLIILGALGVWFHADVLAQSKPSGRQAGANTRPLQAAKVSPDGAQDQATLALDDGEFEYRSGFGPLGHDSSYAAIWLNRFSGANFGAPVVISKIKIYWADNGVVNRQVKLLIYHVPDGDNNPDHASLIFSQLVTVARAGEFVSYTVNASVPAGGDIYIGWEDQWAENGVSPQVFPAALDVTQSQHGSWIFGSKSGAPPDVQTLTNNNYLYLTDDDPYSHAGNFGIRADISYQPAPPATSTSIATATATPIAATPTIGPGCVSSDVCPTDYWFTPVQYLEAHGAISGYNDQTFRPYNNATRAQLAKIVVIAANIPQVAPNTATFSDVPVGAPFFVFIESAVAKGIISGYNTADGRREFRPGNNITRAQLAKIIVGAEGWPLVNPASASFMDVPVGSAFYQYVETAVRHNVVSGYGAEYRPGNPATRGQIAKIVYLSVSQQIAQ